MSLPDGAPLLAPVTLSFKPHEPVLLKGPSGSGKSTLFRVLAGLWPFATGRIRLPAGAKTLFLPQRPYMPIGTLREALWFPASRRWSREAEARAALDAVGLSAFERNAWTRTRIGRRRCRSASSNGSRSPAPC